VSVDGFSFPSSYKEEKKMKLSKRWIKKNVALLSGFGGQESYGGKT
jgi:hypothetical protein